VPWDEALALDAEEQAAFSIIFSELNGGKFNWLTREWEKT
jgi:hypothetical protein